MIDMRGFSMIEVVVAIGILTATLVSVVLISGTSWRGIGESHSEARMRSAVESLLLHVLESAGNDFAALSATSTRDEEFAYDERVQSVADAPGLAAIRTTASSNDAFGGVYEFTQYVGRMGTETGDECTAGYQSWSTLAARPYPLLAGILLPATVPLGHSFSATTPLAALDVRNDMLALAIASTSAKGNDTVFLFNNLNSGMPHYVASFDTNAASIDGVSSVAIAHSYVFVGNAHDASFKTCKPGPSCSQLQVFDISNPASPKIVVSFLLATSSAPGVLGNMTSSGQAIARVLTYQNGYLYVGLSKTASGPEFNILDVHDPSAPQWIGGYAIGASINAITVREGVAYLATDDKSRELMVLDVHDPSMPRVRTSFDPKGTAGYEVGEGAALLGDELFFGMSYASGSPELYVLDGKMLLARRATTTGSTILGLRALGSNLFFVTTTAHTFEARDTQTLARKVAYTLAGTGVNLVCSRDTFFAASNSSGQGTLTLITGS